MLGEGGREGRGGTEPMREDGGEGTSREVPLLEGARGPEVVPEGELLVAALLRLFLERLPD